MPSIVSNIVEICAFKFINGEPRFLLIKRSDTDRIYPGTWQIVTGRIEGEERAPAAAVRELKEETGLSPLKLWVAPTVLSFYSPFNDAVHLSPVFAAEVSDGVDVVLSHEHQDYSWASYHRALELLIWHGQREAVRLIRDYIFYHPESAKAAEIPLQ